MQYPRLMIAGTHSGVGKTTVTLGILAALRRRGCRVQPFKVGPDFIDPGHHSVAAGRTSRNVDGWMLGASVSREIFQQAAADADVSIIEGMMGLFDGSSPINEKGSAAEMAKILHAPVLLVLDGSAVARSVAAMALGFARFDADVHVRGILFNRLSGEGHYRLLKQAVERHTDLEVVGYLERDDSLSISERHLGLVTANNQVPDHLYARLADAIDKTVDLDRIQSLARSAVELEEVSAPYVSKSPDFAGTRVGVAQDEAFCFYYQDNLELLQAEGAELVPFSPLGDAALPDVQLLYLGGGYPEVHAERLRNNKRMRTAVREYATSGGAIYAECGGLMYLMEAIRDFNGKVYDMVGLFPGEAVMSRTSMTLGYRQVEIAKTCVIGEAGMKIRGHEFHYSTLSLRRTPEYSCATTDAAGDRRGQDGLLAGNVIALYTHLHFSSQPQLARALLHSARAASLKREDR